MKSVIALVIGLLAACTFGATASAGPIYDFVVTSLGGPTPSVSGYIEFDNKGYDWSDVVAAQFEVTEDGLGPFVGRPQGDYYSDCCGYLYSLYASFAPNGRFLDGSAFTNSQFNTLRLGGTGSDWSGEFNSDDGGACFNDDNPCTFTGYFELRPGAAVPEPSTIWLFAFGFMSVLSMFARYKAGERVINDCTLGNHCLR